jgi:hypothetical protein
MENILDKNIESGLLKTNGPWYFYKGKNIGYKKDAISFLADLERNAETPNQEEASIETEKSNNVPKHDLDVKQNDEQDTQSKDENDVNPAIKNINELPENLEKIFEPMSHDLSDIEDHKESTKFDIFIFGVNSLNKNHKFIRACKYEFRHNDKLNNVQSGDLLENNGWRVVSKKLISKDPRTGRAWLTVARDDSPKEDFITVGGTVLCYTLKSAYERKKAKMVMKNYLMASKQKLKRQELAKRFSQMATIDPEKSFEGLANINKQDRMKINDRSELKKTLSMDDMEKYIDNINEDNFKESMDTLNAMVNSGKVAGIDTKPLNIRDIK